MTEFNTIRSVTITEVGELEVVRRFPSNRMFTCDPPQPVPDRVVKEIYVVEDGKIILGHIMEATVTPAKVIGETVEF